MAGAVDSLIKGSIVEGEDEMDDSRDDIVVVTVAGVEMGREVDETVGVKMVDHKLDVVELERLSMVWLDEEGEEGEEDEKKSENLDDSMDDEANDSSESIDSANPNDGEWVGLAGSKKSLIIGRQLFYIALSMGSIGKIGDLEMNIKLSWI